MDQRNHQGIIIVIDQFLKSILAGFACMQLFDNRNNNQLTTIANIFPSRNPIQFICIK